MLKHSCFVSYAAGQHDLIKRFVAELTNALGSSLEPRIPRGLTVFWDQSEIVAGVRFEEELARAICRSLCMILVYTPNYERSLYCQREFAAMQKLQRHRFREMMWPTPELGMIIPVILRGRRDDLPAVIRNHIHCLDFTRYTTANQPIWRNHEFMRHIERIAEYIDGLYRTFERTGFDRHLDCAGFKLPVDIKDLWRDDGHRRIPGLPR